MKKKKNWNAKGNFKKQTKTPHTNKNNTNKTPTNHQTKQTPNKLHQTNNTPGLNADKEVLNSRGKEFGQKNTWTKRHVQNSFDISP